MDADAYQKLKVIFQSAVEVSGEERARLLDDKCAGDPALRVAVEKLLASNDTEFLETPAAGNLVGSLGGKTSSSSISGQRIGHYNVERRIGSGGMGDVYLAVDGKLGRRVAIKILPEEFTLDEDRLDRFQLEARAASALSHPNILTIHEIGEWEGTHYIATEYVEGETLRHRFGREPLTVAETLEIGVQLVSAIAAAHEAGICHRDIKPENIMVRRDGIVKVVDFGLAKLTPSLFRADTSHASVDDPTVKIVRTEPGVIMGTVQYMSPEQTRSLPTDERSDIWSLGCVLYEMLAGQPPFTGDSSADLIAEIVKTHPVRLARLDDQIPERFDEIVSKALEKNPEERYQTAKDLLIDLKRLKRRFDVDSELERSNPRITSTNSDEIVTSGPNIISTKKGPKDLTEVNSAQYLYWGMKAHRLTAIAITLFVIGLVGGTAMLVRYYWREQDPNERRLEYYTKIKLAAQALETSNLSLARTQLDELVPQPGETDLRSFEWGYLDRLYRDRSASQPQVLSREKWVSAVGFSRDGKQLATAGADNIVTLWDVPTGSELKTLIGHSKWITSVEFSPDGKRLLTGGFDNTAKVWDVEAGAEILTLTAANNGISRPAFSKDGTLVSAFGNDAIRTWDAATGRESGTIYKPAIGDMAFVFSHDERLFAVRDADQNVSVIDAASGATVAKLKGHTGLVSNIKFSPDSRFLLTSSFDATAKLWEIKTEKEIRTFKGHSELIQAAVFSPDGRTIATGSNDDSIKIWSADDGFLIDTLRGHTGDITSLAFSRDGRHLASGGLDNKARIWPMPQDPPHGVLRGHSKTINAVTFSKDSKMLATASEDGTARIWDADTYRQRLLLDHDSTNVLNVEFSHDGKTLATGAPESLKLWSTLDGRAQRSIPSANRVDEIAFSADDRMIATDQTGQIWDPGTGLLLCSLNHPGGAWTVEFVAEGSRIMTSGSSSVRTWDLRTCAQVSEFQGEEGFEYYSVYSQTGKPWAFQVLNENRSLKLIDTVSGEEIASYSGHEAELWDVDFTPDGKRLATSDISGLIKIWDVPTGHELLTLKANVGEFTSAAFAPDGKTFAVAGHDSIVRLFRSTL